MSSRSSVYLLAARRTSNASNMVSSSHGVNQLHCTNNKRKDFKEINVYKNHILWLSVLSEVFFVVLFTPKS